MIAWLRWLLRPAKNPHCECEIDCGAGIFYGASSVRAEICPTVFRRKTAFMHEYPWNQIGVDGQVLVVDEANKTMRLEKRDSYLESGETK